MDDRNDINKFRKKQQRSKRLMKTVIFAVVTVAVVLIAVNWNSIIKPFRDIVLNPGDGGFPISLPGSTKYIMGELGDNFYLLTDTYLYTYNTGGAELLDIQHGFQEPMSTSNSKRVFVYDKSGKDLKAFSKSSEVFSKTLEDSIVFMRAGTEERCAVVTTSSRYANYLYVFNSEGKQIFRWASPEEQIMGAAFGAGDNSIFVSVVGEINGELQSSILRFDISNTEGETWRIPLGSGISYSLERCPDGIYTIMGQGAFLLDEGSGEIKAQSTFSREITGISETDGVRAVLFRDSGSNGEIAMVLNERLETVAAVSFAGIASFDVKGGMVYILSGNRLSAYNSMLECIKVHELGDEYSAVKIMNGCAYLLGYNKIQRVEI